MVFYKRNVAGAFLGELVLGCRLGFTVSVVACVRGVSIF